MYQIDDRASAVKELQRLLELNQTGLFDHVTRNKVICKQKKHNLPETGIADYKTFSKIVNDYLSNKKSTQNDKYLFTPSFPYSRGDYEDNISLINDAISTILIDYRYEGVIPKGKYFGEETENGVKFIREVFKMDGLAEIDEILMNRILLERSSIEIKQKHGNK